MIITCPCGEKRFEIDAALIPEKGRTLKCGSCDKVWFFKMKLETKSNFTEEKINKLVNDEVLEKTDNLIKKSRPLKKTNDKALVKYKKKNKLFTGAFFKAYSSIYNIIYSFDSCFRYIKRTIKQLYT